MKCDLRNEQEILEMFKMIKQNLGGVDVCVDNAGMANVAPLLSGETNDWREMIDVSLNVHAN